MPSRTTWLVLIGFFEICLVLLCGIVNISPSLSGQTEHGFVMTFVTNISEVPFLTVILGFLLIVFIYILVTSFIPTINAGN